MVSTRARSAGPPSERPPHSWWTYFFLLGLYLSLRGYHSFDGDQAYRLPLLIHQQDPSLYADDPFVRSFDDFNPHRGSLALLDVVSRPVGLPLALFFIFAVTFLVTCRALDRLAVAVWPDSRPGVGWVAIGLVMAAKAGNIGTNHLFEAMVLDRLVALALGWMAIVDVVTLTAIGCWRAALPIALAAIVHPSVGLQLAMVLGTGWVAWALLRRITQVSFPIALRGLGLLALAVVPGLLINLPRGSNPRGDLPDSLFWIFSVELQSPQHMLPHLWRVPQWLAWLSYILLAGLQLMGSGSNDTEGWTSKDAHDGPATPAMAARNRLAIMLAAILIGLGLAWYAIEVQHWVQVTIFQPYRMSTVARGIALILIAGRLCRLWQTGRRLDRLRATVLALGFLGDWLLVVTTLAELVASAIDSLRRRLPLAPVVTMMPWLAYLVTIGLGLNFLGHHDTEYGHVPLVIAVALGIGTGIPTPRNRLLSSVLAAQATGRTRRAATVVGLAWFVPGLALVASLIPPQNPVARSAIVRGLVNRCRFYPMPLDDIERLALWCRDHTPATSRFIAPPGPKTFRLWSRRNLAFSRSGSPYLGSGLSDWFARFQDHVDFRGTPEAFVRAYRDHRHEFEARYDALSDLQRAALARRQGAGYIIARSPGKPGAGAKKDPSNPLELLHVEGFYAVYGLTPSTLVQRQP